MKPLKLLLTLWLLSATGNSHAADMLADMNGWVDGQLAANQSTPGAYLLLMLGGLLASLLPCVYPLYPITASIIQSRSPGQTTRALHPVVYYLGLATIYFVFGLVAATTGGACNELLRLPVTNLLLALLFLVLALATAGLIHLPWFNGNGIGDKTPGITGTFLMGMAAGLLASSCVGPFVVSILVSLAGSQAAGFSLAAALTAAGKMLAFGLGLGLPFLLIGLFGVRLPKSGGWMQYVQWLLGVLILYFSFAYLEKALSGYGFQTDSIQLVFCGALVLLFSVYAWEHRTSPGQQRMERALCILFAVVGTLVLGQGLFATSAVATPAAAPTATATETRGELSWYLNRDDAIKAAREQGKPIFVDFFAYWCANCKAFEHLTLTDRKLIDGLKQAVLLKIYDTDPEFKTFQSDPRFPELKVGLPFFIVMDGDGHLLYKTSDYTRTEDMLLFLGG